ncbi:ATP-dependent DNA helicase RecG [Marinomonas sp. SBI22]|uniref:ATP-dependent DNA helicase RecG n=1 Tax=unclassified Marinomonas TaxID=196814 RepID=UPI0007AEECC0|nr:MULTISPECIES: ATP-dependent DNA helicase RecG [unclassified Marinomonas]KZM40584.1 ATP-dependent DNA helicase RecG [Marinomonas sp. SBI22]KZM42286.1 ATP-dependent DNA helicase RecG [Marinomonas sp. SBI8L]
MDSLECVAVTELKGVGAALAEKLQKLHIETLQDLIFHLPIRYQDRTRVLPIGQLKFGDEIVVEGKVASCEVQMGKRRSLVCRIRDDSGSLCLRFFHFNASQKKQFEAGKAIRCFGEVRRGSTGLEMFHPEYQLVSDDWQAEDDRLTPIYPLTEGITQNKIRLLCEQALEHLSPYNLQEWLPEQIRQDFQLPALYDAVRYLHQPPTDANIEELKAGSHPAQYRLSFEELLAHQLSLIGKKFKAKEDLSISLNEPGEIMDKLLKNLPFSPTNAQNRVVSEILDDLKKGHPMLRLIQGDVGSGKTLVAAMTAAVFVAQDLQVAVMAPTEILAEQHLVNFSQWFKPLGIEVAWMVGKLKGKQREQELAKIASGEAKIVVGTHALFQDSVEFHNLSLAIIDEQHRFGVHQRMALREKGMNGQLQPHQLIMTATPIPRTLAMSAYADLDCSIIDELPPGRTPVTTIVVSDQRRDEVISRVQAACQGGQQAYWVCTLIEESDALQCQAAEDTATMLSEQLQGLSIGLVHGRLKAQEKADIMNRFKAGELQLLVATTVIEVGVDVPNASLMVIENPERLGLAQLHQLRGRVGRGSAASHCVLLYKTPLGQQGKARLSTMRETSDGFKIAEKDLELRGPGELLGSRQTGLMEFKVADLQRDKGLLDQVQATAQRLYHNHPEAISPLLQRWLPNIEHYLNV